MSLPEPTFPEHISNTQRQLFVACPQKWYYAYCVGGRSAGKRGVDLVAGGAFAKGLEVARKAYFDLGRPAEDAYADGEEALLEAYGEDEWPHKPKSKYGTVRAFWSYVKNWPFDMDYLRPHKFGIGTGVETGFSLPLPIQHPTLNQPLLYTGKVDLIAVHKQYSDALWIVDDKLTTSLGPTWQKKWRLDAQPTSYIWAAREMGYTVAGAFIRGTSILTKACGHEEAHVTRTEYQINNWYNQLLRDVHRMKSTFWNAQGLNDEPPELPDRALDQGACNAYGGCPFLDVCSSSNPDEMLASMLAPKPELTEADTIDSIFEGL